MGWRGCRNPCNSATPPQPLHHCTPLGTPLPPMISSVDIAPLFRFFSSSDQAHAALLDRISRVRVWRRRCVCPPPGLYLIRQTDNPDIRYASRNVGFVGSRETGEEEARTRSSRPQGRAGIAGCPGSSSSSDTNESKRVRRGADAVPVFPYGSRMATKTTEKAQRSVLAPCVRPGHAD